jgi:dipeptidyl aminopeptidase/acylaminoacyl peptidase
LRETLKSLSIFSAMLLLLLLISSGCDVNIPGCGKRSLPFFKKVTSSLSQPVTTPPSGPISNNQLTVPPMGSATPNTLGSNSIKTLSSSVSLESSIEMSISSPKFKATQTYTPTSTPIPVDVEKIAYTTMEKGMPTLWTMNTDGTERTRLTAVGTSSWFPLWSPNGKELAFLSNMTEGKTNLFIMKKGGKDFEQLTSFPDMTFTDLTNLKPPFSWSPKSDEIAFIYHNQVWKVDTATHSQVTLADLDPDYSVSAIEWAPHRDNKFVAFLVKKGINFFSLMLVNPRLMDRLTLSESSKALSDISWTADASKVAYLSDKNTIYTASAETSMPKIVILKASPELGPLLSYSPTDESAAALLLTLAKKEVTDDGYRVAIVDKPSSGPTETGSLKYLTEPGVVDAIWSPDGAKIAYVQSGELWVMNARTGANKVRIAATGIEFPTWSKK